MAYTKISANSNSYGGTRSLSSVRYIVIHYTGNKGDTAKANANYFRKSNTRKAGAHFFIDQYGVVIQSVDPKRVAWSVGGFFNQKDGAGTYYKKCTNTNSISIEMCDCKTRDPGAKMILALRDLISYITKICPNAKTIIRHWSVNGKACPLRMVGKNNEKWAFLLKQITKGVTPSTKLATPTVNLVKGSKGEQVKRLQRCLNKIMGTKLAIDGSYGPATVSAVKLFQKKYKLAVDGSCGPKTRVKLKSLV